MKKLTILLFVFSFWSCINNFEKEKVDTIDCNRDIVINSINAWSKIQSNKNICENNIIEQFNNDSNANYKNTRNTIEIHPLIKLTADSCEFDNKNLKSSLNLFNIIIENNLSFTKTFTIKKDSLKIYSTKLNLNFIQVSNGKDSTWILTNICHKDYYKDIEEVSETFLRYKYNIEDNQIISTLNCWVKVEVSNFIVDVGIELENMKISDGQLEFSSDFLNLSLKDSNERYKEQGLELEFE